jgi:hypothetical protein
LPPSISAELAMTELPHPDDQEFTDIKADLGRLFLLHKRDPSMDDWPDEAILMLVNDNTASLIVLMARENGDWPWLLGHCWFFTAAAFDGDDAVPFDS